MAEMSNRFEDVSGQPIGEFESLNLSADEKEIVENGPEFTEILAELNIASPDQTDVTPIVQGEDEALCEEFYSGNDAAFIQLYAKYETPLLHYCRRVMPTDKLAEDAFQDTWIRIFELRIAKPPITNFRALLFKSARNLCLNTRRLERYRAGSSEELGGIKSNDESSRNLEEQEIKSLMTRALAKLPFDQREAFVLHEYSGYSYQEISEMLGTEAATIKVQAFRAKIRLRKLIASWLGLGEDDDPSSAI
jgi:RNA polymerase sigma-70 factor (ECF subfamily)